MVRAPLQPQHWNASTVNLESGVLMPLDELEALSWSSLHELHGLAPQM